MRIIIVIILLTSVLNCSSRKSEVTYYENGDTLSIFSIENGTRNGGFKFFYKNGMLHQEGNLKSGMKDGVFKTYFESGKLSEYYVFKNDSVLYLKEFDEDGKIVENSIGIRYSRKGREKRIINYGDTIHFGYTLLHSMYTKPLIGLDVIRLGINEPNERIAALLYDSMSIEYDLLDYKIGRNDFVLSVMEFDPLDSTFGGNYLDTISFNVLPSK